MIYYYCLVVGEATPLKKMMDFVNKGMIVDTQYWKTKNWWQPVSTNQIFHGVSAYRSLPSMARLGLLGPRDDRDDD